VRVRNRESQVPVILEMMDIPYVGSDGLTLAASLDKVIAKKILLSEGILTPRFFIASSKKDIPRAHSLRFPMIVKPRYEGSSKGITDDSLVKDMGSLVRQIDRVTSLYKQAALVEEFIRGYEFTVALIGNEDPLILEPIQVTINGKLMLDELFYTYAMLDTEFQNLGYVCPPKIDRALNDTLKETARRVYRIFECKDFGRVDFRTDAQGNVYVLGINPLPSLHTADAFGVTGAVIGKTYDDLVAMIVDAGIKRYGLAHAGISPQARSVS